MPSNDDIAKEAAMSRQLIRHYFPQQREMALELCELLATEYRELLAAGVTASPEANRLEGLIDFYFGIPCSGWPAKPRDAQVYDALFSLATDDAELRQLLSSHNSLLASVFAQEIQMTYPDLPEAAGQDLAFSIVSMMYGHWRMVSSLGFDEKQNVIMRDCVDRLIKSYVASPPAHDKADRVKA